MLALALGDCLVCRGCGAHFTAGMRLSACPCVLRSVFRICQERFERCSARERWSAPRLEISTGRGRPMTWGRKDQEYIADFTLLTKRALSERDYRIFRHHFVAADQGVRLKPATLREAIARIEQKLGKIFAETQPYPLFPVDEYFNGAARRVA